MTNPGGPDLPHPADPEARRSGGAPEWEARPRSGWADFQQLRHRYLAGLARDSAGVPRDAPPPGGGRAPGR
ncbi:MAG: hypothetical protein AB1416_06970 [Actinomycetota bacterium]